MTMVQSKKEVAYDYLKRAIVTCEIRPGSMLDENEVAKQVGISRTPVREAVNQLAQEGMLEIIPRKGIVVSQMTIKDIFDLLDARLTIEPDIVRKALPLLDKGSLLELRETLENKSQSDDESIGMVGRDFDYDFHMFFALKTNNQYLIDIERRLMMLNQRTRYLMASVRDERPREVCREHLDIVNKLIAGDEDGAVKALEEHLNNAFLGFDELRMAGNAVPA